MNQVAVVIPSLNPDEKLVRTVTELALAGFGEIVVVDDGSGEGFAEPFAAVGRLDQCTLLRHEVNLGKGRALKTAFAYLLEHRPGLTGAVTVDGDGQHLAADAVACAEALSTYPDSLILGARDFGRPEVPWRSRAGNRLTSFVFRALYGLRISDTQTGLRALPAGCLELFLRTEGERFEYETNMLLDAGQNAVPVKEIGISTVYLEGNASSHFQPLRDSMMIYRRIFCFTASSLAAALVDLGVFTAVNLLLAGMMQPAVRLLAAAVAARIVSALVNYIANHKAVFQSGLPFRKTFLRYAALACIQLTASYLIVFALSAMFRISPWWDSVYKMMTDVVLFFLSFRIQQQWIFK